METYDYVIVGAGSAGCVLAHRLAEKGYSICVLEAGPRDSSPYIRMPAGFMKTFNNPALTWNFNHLGTPNTYGRSIPFIQGKTLGGSSALNGTIYSRGQSWDYDNWASLGNEGWDFESVLPYFCRNESFMGDGEEGIRGRQGNILTDRVQFRSTTAEAFLRAAVESGSTMNEDYNGRSQTGAAWAQATVYKGRRWSSAHAYLHPARKRFGVRVLTHALAKKIIVEHGRAAGVEYFVTGDPAKKTVRSRLCTIVSAGTVNTPKLLQLSGIGPADLLQDLGIPVIVNLPGVGRNLIDHYAARVVMQVNKGVDTVNGRIKGLGLAKEAAAWMLHRPSVMGMSVVSAYDFGKIDKSSPVNDYAITFTPASFKLGMTRKLDDVPGVTLGAWGFRQQSRGFVRIQSTDFNAPPIVQPNYLDAVHDRRVLVAGLKRISEIVKAPSLAKIVTRQIFPTQSCHTDDEWLDFIRQSGMTTYHLVGTCKMGRNSDPMSVVDSRLKVHGILDLRIVDASIMPEIPSGNTNAATLMIAEKAADMIIEDHKLQ